MKELAADGALVTVECRVLKLARQPYSRGLSAPIPEREVVAAYRANALFDAHRDDPGFGHRLLVDEAHQSGHAMADRTAWHLYHSNRWWSVFGKKWGTNGTKPGPPVHAELVQHGFTADAPKTLCLADVTERKTGEGKLYLCVLRLL